MVIVNFNCDQMTNVYQLLYSRNSTERVKLNIRLLFLNAFPVILEELKSKFSGIGEHAPLSPLVSSRLPFAFSPPPPSPSKICFVGPDVTRSCGRVEESHHTGPTTDNTCSQIPIVCQHLERGHRPTKNNP